MNKIQTL